MKVCSKCGYDYPAPLSIHFSKKSDTADGLQFSCKKCHSQYLKSHYNENKSYYKDKAHVRNKEIRITNLQFVMDYLKEHPCVDCGEKDPLVLEFDHLRDKTKEISRMVRDSVSVEVISKEIEKCEVRCCNCHRRKTIVQFGWYKDIQL